MNLIKSLTRELSSSKPMVLLSIFTGATVTLTQAQTTNPIPVLQIKADQVTTKVSPMLYGLMTEEINYSYEGGLYGELIRNRAFKANPTNTVFWDTVGTGSISLDTTAPLNDALNVSLKLDAATASKTSPAGFANGGYWGIPVKPKTIYHASFYAKAADGFSGALTVNLQSADGKTVFASAQIPSLTGDWKKYEVTLTTKKVKASKENQFTITTASPGTIWFQQVSLFPPTFANRANNGNRPDLMQLMADMNPKFLRFPGGNYLEGDYINERFDWKKTIGDVSQRPGHRSPWNYWSTDGFGLLEYLGWCEDLHMEPVLAVYAGFSLPTPENNRRGTSVKVGPDLEPYVQDALDEIEYVTGDTNTTWGAQRAKDGHPAPFPLHYVEVGNEDQFDRYEGGSYDGRFAQFFDAIKAKYPQLQVIATTKVKSRVPDVLDEHYYRSQEEMELHALDYDKYSRTNHTKIFCGEWATRVGSPTPNMAGALGDAAWMTGMERNSDIVLMHCYAPLFVNVSTADKPRGQDGSMQWKTDLIGYDALNSYGSPAYYAQKMFSTHHGDVILATDSQDISMQTWQPPARRRNGAEQTPPAAQQIRKLFFDATRDSRSGTIFLKVVNSLGTPQPVKIEISGVASIAAKGTATVLKAEKIDDTNSIQEPKKIVPVTEKANGLGANFMRTFPPYSITVLELKAK
jgi:alpha-N-arabinofuranosidase